jgi:hypothetical protein
MRLSGMAQHLAMLGEPLEEPKLVAKFLRSVPRRYMQIVLLIQTLLDISTLTLANVMGRLKAAEQKMKGPPPMVNHNGKLYLTEEAWVEKWKLCDSDKQFGGGPGGRGGGWHDRGGGHGNGEDRGTNESSSTGTTKLAQNQCKKCFKFGHWG